MATPAAATTVILTNLCGDTASLVSSIYGSAPVTIRTDTLSVSFQQNISTNTPGSLMYDIGKFATWMISWTADNRIAIQIVPAGTAVTWQSIWDTLRPNYVNISATMPDGSKYNSKAEITSTVDAQIVDAEITYSPPPN
ncbi:hypothetical protein V6N13_005532 [Hibiscus sabdariffa]|uniref:Uncharacterized protein n=1 Tax=Hibiscus sabdariffa TaxID=183260 RepID=A0ABR2EQE1_9ROSI